MFTTVVMFVDGLLVIALIVVYYFFRHLLRPAQRSPLSGPEWTLSEEESKRSHHELIRWQSLTAAERIEEMDIELKQLSDLSARLDTLQKEIEADKVRDRVFC